ncbi:MAG: tail fiber domain-containing protein [Gemmatimonadota bacterium]|nr:MAG: tail fiber domain-containing protein [Gemmatimonadota bacterium]
MKAFKTFVTVALMGILCGAVSALAFPGMFYYTGKLTDGAGVPITGTVSITFNLYNVTTGGSPVWTEAHGSVDVDEGSYTVLLGSITPNLDLMFDGSDKWLGITVGSDSEMTPRHKVGSVPYAMNADRLDGKHASGFVSTTDGSQEITGSAGDWMLRAENMGNGIGLDGYSNGWGAAVRGQCGDGGIGVHGVSIDGWGGYFQSVNGPGLAAEAAPGHLAAWLNGNVDIEGVLEVDSSAVIDGVLKITNPSDSNDFLSISSGDTWTSLIRITDGAAIGQGLMMSSNGLVSVEQLSSFLGMSAGGLIHSTMGGFKFPDGSVQTTAAGAASSDWGRYNVTDTLYEGTSSLSDKYVTLDCDTMQEISGSTTDWCILRVENLGTAGGICAYAAGGGEGVTSYSNSGAAVNGVSATGYGGYFQCTNGVGLVAEGSPVAAWFEGYVGIDTTNPSYPLHMGSGAHCTAGGVWTNASSRKYKENIHELTSEAAVEALEDLNPVTFNYKVDKDEQHLGFIAEDVPELVSTKDREGMSPMDVVAVLTKVVQEQQKTIDELKRDIADLKEEVE